MRLAVKTKSKFSNQEHPITASNEWNSEVGGSKQHLRCDHFMTLSLKNSNDLLTMVRDTDKVGVIGDRPWTIQL